jgi:hypothetical protein
MTFGEVWRQGLRSGKKAKRSKWGGYWVWDEEKKTIMMHCKDGRGRVLDIRDTDNARFTFDNISANDWEIVEEDKERINREEIIGLIYDTCTNVDSLNDIVSRAMSIYGYFDEDTFKLGLSCACAALIEKLVE